MRVLLSRVARGVAPAAALAWWSDFQDGHHDHPFVPGERRRIVERDGSRTVMEDRAPLWRERTTAWVEADRVRIEGENLYARFRGAYVFEPHRDGTLVRLDAVIAFKHVFVTGAFLARPLLRLDLKGHVREMERDLA
jgi:hypothetical protein